MTEERGRRGRRRGRPGWGREGSRAPAPLGCRGRRRAPGAGSPPTCAAGLVGAPRDLWSWPSPASAAVTRPWATRPSARAADHPEWSVARRWDEALLDAIRRALPNPPVHARNLFHMSVAMWDAWAAYDPTAPGYSSTEKDTRRDVPAARERGDQLRRLSRAAPATSRRSAATESLSEFDDVMDSLCYPSSAPRPTATRPPRSATGSPRRSSPTADRRLERGRRLRRAGLQAGQSAARRRQSGTTMIDPNRWQPLQLEHMISQNGIPVDERRPAGHRAALGSRQGLRAAAGGGRSASPIDPGPPPRLGDPATDQAFKDQAVEVIRDSACSTRRAARRSTSRPARAATTRSAPTTGRGHPVNPATGAAVRARGRQRRATSTA